MIFDVTKYSISAGLARTLAGRGKVAFQANDEQAARTQGCLIPAKTSAIHVVRWAPPDYHNGIHPKAVAACIRREQPVAS